MWNYAKLSFNSKYPWEAGATDMVESQQYVLLDDIDMDIRYGNVTHWCGEKDGVLYRRQFFGYDMEKECHWMHAINLADFPVAYGIMRVDKMRLYSCPIRLTLGAYGFPDNGTDVEIRKKNGATAMILKGHDHMGKEKQLAMTIFDGWNEIELLHSTGTNPDSEKSLVVYAKTGRDKKYGYEPYVLISQVITKESLEEFSDADLFPIRKVHYTDRQKCGGYGPITIELLDGTRKTIDYDQIEGHLMQ